MGIKTNMYNRKFNKIFGKIFANAVHSHIIYPRVSMFDLDPSVSFYIYPI